MTTAFGLVIVGGVLAALFIVPTTTTPAWKWENIWGLGSLVALVAVPWPLAWATVPHLGEVYRTAGIWPVVLASLFGVGWGLGGIFWGQAIVMLGLGLGTSIMVGLVNVFGSPVPLAMKEPAKLLSPGGLLLLGAMLVLVVGVAICAWAGKRRDAERLASPSDAAGTAGQASFGVALLFCLLAGALSAMNNFGPIFGQRIVDAAVLSGASELGKMNAMWAPLFTANYLINGGYALYLMLRRGTLRLLVTARLSGLLPASPVHGHCLAHVPDRLRHGRQPAGELRGLHRLSDVSRRDDSHRQPGRHPTRRVAGHRGGHPWRHGRGNRRFGGGLRAARPGQSLAGFVRTRPGR